MDFSEIKRTLSYYSDKNKLTIYEVLCLFEDVLNGVRREMNCQVDELPIGDDSRTVGKYISSTAQFLVAVYNKNENFINRDIKIEIIRENRKEIFTRLEDISKKLAEVEEEDTKQKSIIEKYKNACDTLENDRKTADEYKEKIDKKEEELKKVRKSTEEYKNKIVDLISKRTEEIQNLNKQKAEYELKYKKYEKSYNESKLLRDNAKKQLEVLTEKYNAVDVHYKEIKKEYDKKDTDIINARSSIESIEKDLQNKEAEKKKLQGELNTLSLKIDKTTSEVNEYIEKKIPEANAELALKTDEKKQKSENLTNVNTQINLTKNALKKLDEEAERKKEEQESLQTTIDSYEKEISKLEENIKNKGKREKNLSEEIDSLRKQAAAKNIAELEKLLADERKNLTDLCNKEMELKDELKIISEQNIQAQKSISETKTEFERIESDTNKISEDIKTAEEKIKKAKEENISKQSDLHNKEKELKNANTILQEFRGREYDLKLERYNKALKQIKNALKTLFPEVPIYDMITEQMIKERVGELEEKIRNILDSIKKEQEFYCIIVNALEKGENCFKEID